MATVAARGSEYRSTPNHQRSSIFARLYVPTLTRPRNKVAVTPGPARGRTEARKLAGARAGFEFVANGYRMSMSNEPSPDPFTPPDPNQPDTPGGPSIVPIVTDVPERLPPLEAPAITEPEHRH